MFGTPPQGGAPPPQGQGWQQPPGGGAYQPQESASGMAVAALVLGLVSWVMGGLLTAIPGAIIGKMEMDKIKRGESPAAGKTFAEVGFWASVAHIVIALLALVFVFCIFGGAILAALGASASSGGGY